MLDQLKEAFRTTTYFTNGLTVEQAFKSEGAINVIYELIQGTNGPFYCDNTYYNSGLNAFTLMYRIEELEIKVAYFNRDVAIESIEKISNYLEIKGKLIRLEIKKAALTL